MGHSFRTRQSQTVRKIALRATERCKCGCFYEQLGYNQDQLECSPSISPLGTAGTLRRQLPIASEARVDAVIGLQAITTLAGESCVIPDLLDGRHVGQGLHLPAHDNRGKSFFTQ